MIVIRLVRTSLSIEVTDSEFKIEQLFGSAKSIRYARPFNYERGASIGISRHLAPHIENESK